MIKKYKKILLICGIILASILFAASLFIFYEYKKFDPEVGLEDDFSLQDGIIYKKLEDFITKYNNEDIDQDSEDENGFEGIDAI